jgi:hypothetical protein
LITQVFRTRTYGAVWFLLWWLFLHRRLRSRQRGLAFASRLLLSSEVIGFRSATRFYPGAESKPFGFSPRRN